MVFGTQKNQWFIGTPKHWFHNTLLSFSVALRARIKKIGPDSRHCQLARLWLHHVLGYSLYDNPWQSNLAMENVVTSMFTRKHI